MIIRLSQKLCTKIKAGSLTTMPLDTNPFADWSAHLFVADRRQYIIISNTKSLYSALMSGKGKTNASQFIERAMSSIREFMEADRQQFIYRRFIAPVSGSGCFAKPLDRTVTGSMNELILHARTMLTEGEMSLHDIGISLNDVLLSAIAPSKSQKYGKPREVFKNLLSESKQKQATS